MTDTKQKAAAAAALIEMARKAIANATLPGSWANA